MPLPNPYLNVVDKSHRSSKSKAKSVLEKITSNPQGCLHGAKVIVEVIAEVNKLGPEKWRLVMYKSDPAIRLLVGDKEIICTAIEDKLWLPNTYIKPMGTLVDVAGWDSEYLELTEPSFIESWEKIRPFFFRGIESRVANAIPPGTRYKGAHCSGVLDYLCEIAEIDALPEPSWNAQVSDMNNEAHSGDTRQRYNSEQLIKFARVVFDIYCNNFHNHYDLRYSVKPPENKDRIHKAAREIGINDGTSENYSERLFNLFNRLSGHDLNNGLADPPSNLLAAGEKVYDADALMINYPINENTYNEQLNKQVASSFALTDDGRHQLLEHASGEVETLQVVVKQFKRNPHVIVEVLLRADGICESCGKDAPFIRKSDNTPYLEVHHKHPLAEGGPDTVKNAVALCPNCHREEHFGA